MREMLGGCCVCSDERGWDENPLVYCDGQGCSVAVHQACYGIVTVPTGPWFCRKCESQERAARVKCELCPRKDGALKRTDSGGWCHVVCALFIPEAWFGNVQTMEPIILKGVPADRYNKVCYICEEEGKAALSTSGACMQCNKTGCKQHFHVTCAQTKGLLCEEAGNSANDVKYCGYCNQHSRKKKRDATCKPLPAFKPVATDSTDPVPEKISPSGRQDKNKTRPGTNVGQNSSSQKGMGLSSTASKAESKERSLSRSSSLSSSSDHSSAVTSRTVSTGPSSSTSSTPSTSIAGAAAAHSTSTASKPTTGGGKFTTANFVETTIQASPANFNNNAASSKSLKSETSPSSFFTSSPSKLDISGIVSMDTKPGIKTLDTAGKTTATSADRSLADTDASVLTLSDSKRTSESERSTVKSNDTNSSKNSSSDSKLNKKSDDSKYKKTVGQSVPDIQASVRSVEESKRNNEYNFDRSDSPPILTSITSMPISSKSRGKKEQTAVDSKTVSEEGREITVTGRASTGSKRPLNKNEENGTTEQRKVKKPRGEKAGPRGKGVAKETSNSGSAGLRSPKEGPSKGHKPYNQTPAGSSNSFSEQDSSHRFGFLSKDSNGLLGPSVPSMSSLFAASQASGSEAGSQFPTTMEQLLERQWVQGSQFLMEQGQHFDSMNFNSFNPIFSTKHSLRQENQRLEEHITSLTSRRDQLLAVNARLSVPFGSQAPSTSSSAVPSSTSLSNTSPLRNHTPRTNEEPFSAGRSFITGLAGSLSAGYVPGLASLTMAGSDERNAIAGLVGIGGGDRNAVLGLVGSDGRNSVIGASYLSPALNKNNRVNHGAPHDVNMSARDGSGRSPAGSGGSVNTSTPGPLSSPLMDGHPPSVTMAPPHIHPPHATAVDQFLGTHILTAGLSSPRGRGGGQLLSPSRRRTASAGYSGDPTPPGPVMSHPLIASAMAGQPFTMSAVGPQLSGSRLHESLLVPAAAVSIAEQLHRQQQQKGLLDVDKSPSLLYQLQQQHQSQLLSTGLTAAQLLPSAEKLMQQTHQALNNSLPGLAGSDKLHLSALPGGGVMNSQLVRMGNDIEFSRTVNKNNSAKQARTNNDK